MEALGFAQSGEGSKLYQEGQWVVREGGAKQLSLCGSRGLVINPSGGLETKGHPIGATGEIAQELLVRAAAAEFVRQAFV